MGVDKEKMKRMNLTICPLCDAPAKEVSRNGWKCMNLPVIYLVVDLDDIINLIEKWFPDVIEDEQD